MTALETYTTDVLPAGLPFSAAVRHGDLIFVSGNIGNLPGEPKLVEGGVATETTQALAHMAKALDAAGSAPDRVVKCVVFLADMADFQAMNEAYAAFFGDHRPARSTVAVNGLALGARVELDCIAAAG